MKGGPKAKNQIRRRECYQNRAMGKFLGNFLAYRLLIAITVISDESTAFTSHGRHPQSSPTFVLPINPITVNKAGWTSSRHSCRRSSDLVPMMVNDDDSAADEDDRDGAAATASSSPVSSSTQKLSEQSTSYPIDLPSPILLATSMILAIVSTGAFRCSLCD